MADEIDSVILTRLKLLDERLEQLESYSEQALNLQDYVDNVMLRDAVERSFQVAIEACLDIGRRLIAIKGMHYPENNQRVFLILAQNGVVSPELLGALTAMVGFWNIIVHDYADINNQTVYEALKSRLDDIRHYAQAIEKYLSI